MVGGGTASWLILATLLLPYAGTLLARSIWPQEVVIVSAVSLSLMLAVALLAWFGGRRLARRAGPDTDIRPMALLSGVVLLALLADRSQGVLAWLASALRFSLPLLAFWLGARPPRAKGDRPGWGEAKQHRTLARRCRFLLVWLILLANPLGLVAIATAVDGTRLAGVSLIVVFVIYFVLAVIGSALLGRWLRRRWQDDPVSPGLVLPPALLPLALMLLPGMPNRLAALAVAAALLLLPGMAFTVGLLGIPRRRAA